MENVILTVGNVNDKLTLAHALSNGYNITLDGDGCAKIQTPKNKIYHVYQFECDCPDSWCRKGGSIKRANDQRTCKHVSWVAQLWPCEYCSGTMQLGQFVSALGVASFVFCCPDCDSTESAESVRDKRNAHAQEVAK